MKRLAVIASNCCPRHVMKKRSWGDFISEALIPTLASVTLLGGIRERILSDGLLTYCSDDMAVRLSDC